MALTVEQKIEIMAYKNAGWSAAKIAKHFKVARGTVYNVIKNHEQRGTHERKKGSGPRKKLTERDVRTLVRELHKDPHILLSDLTQKLVTKVSEQTVRRELHRLGY
ncbi:Homeodomain-like protein [Radiomyces spectabilis]|uniref:Homeodomain-like protein n=1 Tax=Radiomyces spectabilis TaxID=64574 RepID=UPI00221F3355|nr:Homeodomain-like protein [Radiomyces spectabilis]KAI8364703.1 Homeodomain-like protein [Radiomyces spectabilis]